LRGQDRSQESDDSDERSARADEIIGVVGDLTATDFVTESRPMTYWPHPQLAYGAMTLALRTASDPAAFAPR